MRWLTIIFFFTLVLSLSACNTPAPPVAGPGVAFAAEGSVTPRPTTLTPSPTRVLPTVSATAVPPSATPTTAPVRFTPSPTPCQATAGEVVSVSVPSTALNYPIDTLVYLPPCYAISARRYPTLYLIHGLGFTEDQWVRLGVVTATNTLLAQDAIAPLIIVMPRDRRSDRFDPALVEDLLPYIDSHYRTKTERAQRAIGGLSRGAGWAIHLGLHYHELFGRIGLHSPAVFYGDENNLLQYGRSLIKIWAPTDYPAVYIDIGDNDRQINSAAWLNQVLTWFKFKQLQYIVRPGAHTESYWSANVEEYMRFYAGAWLPTPPPPATATPQWR